MTTLERRSPKLPSYTPADLKAAIETLEDMPRIPEKVVASSSSDGFEGQIVTDAGYLKIYRDGSWKRTLLSSF